MSSRSAGQANFLPVSIPVTVPIATAIAPLVLVEINSALPLLLIIDKQ